MVVDTSALVAILTDEPERPSFDAAIAADPHCLLSAANLLEARMVLYRRSGDTMIALLDGLLYRAGIAVRPVTPAEADLAFDAFRRYGKGVHRAGLNYGDCFAYALSKATGEPLLFKGTDFAATDVATVSF